MGKFERECGRKTKRAAKSRAKQIVAHHKKRGKKVRYQVRKEKKGYGIYLD